MVSCGPCSTLCPLWRRDISVTFASVWALEAPFSVSHLFPQNWYSTYHKGHKDNNFAEIMLSAIGKRSEDYYVRLCFLRAEAVSCRYSIKFIISTLYPTDMIHPKSAVWNSKHLFIYSHWKYKLYIQVVYIYVVFYILLAKEKLEDLVHGGDLLYFSVCLKQSKWGRRCQHSNVSPIYFRAACWLEQVFV